MFKAR